MSKKKYFVDLTKGWADREIERLMRNLDPKKIRFVPVAPPKLTKKED